MKPPANPEAVLAALGLAPVVATIAVLERHRYRSDADRARNTGITQPADEQAQQQDGI